MITALQAEEMELVLRLDVPSLSYAIYAPDGSLYREERTEYSPEEERSASLVNWLYERPELGLPYRSVRIYYRPLAVALVPESLYDKECPELWLPTMSEGSRPLRVLPYALGEAKVFVGLMEEELVALLMRHYLLPQFVPIYAEALQEAIERSRVEGSEELFVDMGYERVFLAKVSPEGLRFAASYDFVEPHDRSACEGELRYYQSLVTQYIG